MLPGPVTGRAVWSPSCSGYSTQFRSLRVSSLWRSPSGSSATTRNINKEIINKRVIKKMIPLKYNPKSILKTTPLDRSHTEVKEKPPLKIFTEIFWWFLLSLYLKENPPSHLHIKPHTSLWTTEKLNRVAFVLMVIFKGLDPWNLWTISRRSLKGNKENQAYGQQIHYVHLEKNKGLQK